MGLLSSGPTFKRIFCRKAYFSENLNHFKIAKLLNSIIFFRIKYEHKLNEKPQFSRKALTPSKSGNLIVRSTLDKSKSRLGLLSGGPTIRWAYFQWDFLFRNLVGLLSGGLTIRWAYLRDFTVFIYVDLYFGLFSHFLK